MPLSPDLREARFWPTSDWPTLRELIVIGAFLGASLRPTYCG